MPAMAVAWTIAGEAGKTVNATPRSLPALSAEGAEVVFNSLESDVMSWNIPLASKDNTAMVPDQGQRITLFRNGTRYFTGIVTVRRIKFDGQEYRAEIEVEGPWWWLKQIPLSSNVPDQSGSSSERTAFVFPTGSPRTSLIALIYRAIELGAPISEGSIASVFSVPRLSLRNVPFSEAIAELMRWVADGIVYFDYSVEGHPALCMQRRGPATTITINPANLPVGGISLNPRLDLQVEELSIFYARRDTVGNKRVTVWDSQAAGASTTGLPRRQLALISGPEIDTYLPQDFTDSVTVRSAPIDAAAIIRKYDDRIRAAGGTFSVGAFSEPIFSGTFTLPHIQTRIVDTNWEPMAETEDGGYVSIGGVTPDPETPPPVDASYAFYLTHGESRDWWAKQGIEFIDARLSATIHHVHTSPFPLPNGYKPVPPPWYEIIGGQVYTYFTTAPVKGRWVYTATVSVPVTLVKKRWAVDTVLIRAEDYAFVNPPTGLATNLLATQNWLPQEGSVGPVAVEDIPEGNAVGSVLNLSGFMPQTANMRALVRSYRVRPALGTVTYSVGAPSRFAFRDLVNRFRQSGADNIVWLVDSVSGNPGENPPPDPELEVPVGDDGSLTFGGEYIVFDGSYLTFVPAPAGALAFSGSILKYDDDFISYN